MKVPTLSPREKRIQFVYLLLLTLACAGLATWTLFVNFDYPRLSGSYIAEKIAQERAILLSHESYKPLLDSTYRSIVIYQPQTKAVFLEADINNQIEDIRDVYNNHRQDVRF